MSRRLAILLLGAVALAGCGENDKADADRTVREFVKATNDRDANKLCEDLLTKDFIEQATGATGQRARTTCKQQFKAFRGLKVRLVRITKTEVHGDKAKVTAVIVAQDQPQPRVFNLRKENGKWRLAGGTAG